MKKCHHSFNLIPLAFFFLFLISLFNIGCVSAKKAMYFPDMKAGEILIDSVVRESAKRVYPGDRVAINIITGDVESNLILNSVQGKSSGQGQLEGYFVDKDGFVYIPIIGAVNVRGLTPTEIRDMVQSKLMELYKDVVVNCTISGRVIILNSIGGLGGGAGGGVSSVPITDERLTILEVLSGLRTSNLKLDKAWIIREVDGKRVTSNINLNSKDIFTSPYYYLRNNDVFYIEPNKLNQFLEVNAPSRSLLGIVTGMTGLFLSLIVLLK